MTLPQPLSYPPLPNHSYRIHHYPTTPPLPTLLPLHTVSYHNSYPSLALLPTHQHPPQTSFSLHTPTTTTQPLTHPLLSYPTIPVLSTCPNLLHPFSPTHPYHYHYSLPYLTLTSFPTLPYHLPLSQTPCLFLTPPYTTHPLHIPTYPAYPLPYSYISLVCHTLQLKAE